MDSILNNHPLLKQEIDKVAEVAGHLWQKGWAERNGGNITVNITHLVDDEIRNLKPISEPLPIGDKLNHLADTYFYCKGTGKRMRDLARQPMENGSIIRVLPDCANYVIVADNPVMPTSELPSHLAIHDYLIGSGSNYKASLHTHPIELVAMSHNPKMLKPGVLTRTLHAMIPETLAFAPLGLGIVPYQLPGSVKLARATLEQIRDYDVVMWEKHGTFSVGTDIMDAFDQVDCLNKSALIYIAAKNMGYEPTGLTDVAMKEVQKVFKLPKTRPS